MSRPCVYIHRVEWCPAGPYLPPENRELLASFAELRDHGDDAEALSHEQLVAAMQGADAVLALNGSHADDITAAALREAGTVQCVAITHWPSVELQQACAEADVALLDVIWPCTEAVAEWSLGSLINGLRRTDYFDRQIKAGAWPAWQGTAAQLNGSTVGIVAAGRIGVQLIRYLKPFDVEVLVYDPFLSSERAAELGVRSVDLHVLMSSCDAIALHAPNTPETKDLIGKKELQLMRDGALLVNGARSFLIDSAAFREEMLTGRIRAALDVFDHEPLQEDEAYLRELDNVVLTPHVAGTTDRMFARCGYFGIKAIQEHLAVLVTRS